MWGSRTLLTLWLQGFLDGLSRDLTVSGDLWRARTGRGDVRDRFGGLADVGAELDLVEQYSQHGVLDHNGDVFAHVGVDGQSLPADAYRAVAGDLTVMGAAMLSAWCGRVWL
jgi:hypothetical protein